ncbi:hypothetical protein PZ897_07150 [Hoeflea sp. YIM 152468]|uniref:hypothetical protein n=1 Tax=Hoeflea sp. YIM 152468 TaxID=3031759 RepID=UPI0023DA2C9E|nr:hypothetical protein [Hoeflea sp. YIM 152468]MDF1607946.1 hypothetical protein [Hoeflea sp. YIM 152468]
MIGIDSNIIVRLLMRDDKKQFDAAGELVKSSDAERPLFVNPMVMGETIWTGLLDTVEIRVPEMLQMKNWAEWLHSPYPDLSGAVIAGLNRENGCEKPRTSDRKTAASVPGMELLA